MTATPPTSTPSKWPLDDEIFAIDQKIAELQRAAAQAQASSAVAASEVAIVQKAIQELSTAKAEIEDKERLWEREEQLKTALQARQAVAERVRAALGTGGSLAGAKTALEAALKPKVNLQPAALLDSVNDEVDTADKAWKKLDQDAEQQRLDARKSLADAEADYAAKAADAEKAWNAIQSSGRWLEEQLLTAQQQLDEAKRLTASASDPTDKTPGPGKTVSRSAAEAGVAWKDLKDTYTALDVACKQQQGAVDDEGQKQLRKDWADKSKAVKDALAVLLIRRRELADADQKAQQRQASRPRRTPKEQTEVVDALLKKLNP